MPDQIKKAFTEGHSESNWLSTHAINLSIIAEDAAIAAYRLVGSGDEKAADQAAVDAMRSRLNTLDFNGRIVIGEGERDEAPMLYIGEKVGSGQGMAVDIALDPLEGTTLAAKAMNGNCDVGTWWYVACTRYLYG